MSNTPSDEDIVALAISEGIKLRTGAGVVKLARAVLAKWGTPQPADCTRSHPHEDMSGYCLLRTEIARLANENARLKASQSVVEPLTTLTIAPVRRFLADRGIYLSDETTKELIVVAHGITKGGSNADTGSN